MQRQTDASVVRALAEMVAAQGVQSRLVDRALRVAEKMEGRPRDGHDLAARRRSSKRMHAAYVGD